MLSLVEPVTLNLRYATTRAVDKSASVVYTLPGVHFTSANCASLVGRVIFVMIVILKGFAMILAGYTTTLSVFSPKHRGVSKSVHPQKEQPGWQKYPGRSDSQTVRAPCRRGQPAKSALRGLFLFTS